MTELQAEEIDFLNSIFDLARENKPVALKSLLDQGIPANLANAKGDTLLILAAYHEHLNLVHMLLEEGAEINALNDRGQTALVCATFRNNLDIARLLLDRGADASLGLQTPAQVAEFFNLPEMKELFAA